jgi:hypothetical protein
MELPLFGQSFLDPFEVASGASQIGLDHLDVVETHDWIDWQGVDPGPLPHDLAMHLAVRRNIDNDVVDNEGRTTEPPALPEGPPGVVVGLRLRGR